MSVNSEIADLLSPNANGDPLGQGTGTQIPASSVNINPINLASAIPQVAGYGTPSTADPLGGTGNINQLPSGSNPVTTTSPNIMNVLLLIAVTVGGVWAYNKYIKKGA